MNITFQHDDYLMKTFSSETISIYYPKNEIEEIRSALLPVGSQVNFNLGKHINLSNRYNKKVCYILLDGYVSYRHKENGVVISYAYAGSLIGIGNFLIEQNAGFFRAETNIETMCVSEDEFQEIFNKNSLLWKSLTYYMTYITQRLMIRDVKVNTKTAYQTVKNLLNELSIQPEDVCHKINASYYILERTHLARSTVMSILSQLQKGSYIELKNGHLLRVNKLPEQF